MGKCDICSKVQGPSESGWLTITHGQLKASTDLVSHAFRVRLDKDFVASPEAFARARDEWLQQIEARFGESDWLLCSTCADVYSGANLARAAVPRPSHVYVFGRGFRPSQQDVSRALNGLLRQSKGKLTGAHLDGLPIESRRVVAEERERFFQIVPSMRRQYPDAYVADSILLDQRSGQDTIAVLVWQGEAARAARQQLSQAASGSEGLGKGPSENDGLRRPEQGPTAAPPVETPGLIEERTEKQTCPYCHKPMPATGVVCLQCGYNRVTKETIRERQRKQRAKHPESDWDEHEYDNLSDDVAAILRRARERAHDKDYDQALSRLESLKKQLEAEQNAGGVQAVQRAIVESLMLRAQDQMSHAERLQAERSEKLEGTYKLVREELAELGFTTGATEQMWEDARQAFDARAGEIGRLLKTARTDLSRAKQLDPQNKTIDNQLEYLDRWAKEAKISTGACFIATAAYGTPLAAEVETLRQFRDRVLLPSRTGRVLVEAYYLLSPPVAFVLDRTDRGRALVRGLLRPVIAACRRVLHTPS